MSRKRRKMLVVKVGSDDRPASSKDIADVQNALKKMKKSLKGIGTLVGNHTIKVEVVEI